MEKYIITEDEKNRILNLHIERTKNLYLSEQQVKLTSKMKETLMDDADYQDVKGSLTKIRKFPTVPELNKDVRAWIKPDGTYHIDSLPITNVSPKVPSKVLSKGVWTFPNPEDASTFSWGVIKLLTTNPPVANELPEWAECIKEQDLFKNIKVKPNDKNFVSQKDLAGNLNVFTKDGKYFLKGIGNTIIERGKWKCFPMIGLFIEYTNGRKYFNGKFYDIIKAKKIPSLISLIADGEKLAGKIGDKLVKWWDDTEKWVEDNSGGGSSDNGSSNDNKPCTPLTDSEKKGPDFYNIRIPGDTKYIYGKDENGNWFTKNIVNTNQFNLTKCKYDKAIKKLEKEGKQVSSPQKPELDNVTSAPNDKVNIAYVEPKPKPETTPLATSDKVTDNQEEMSATTKL